MWDHKCGLLSRNCPGGRGQPGTLTCSGFQSPPTGNSIPPTPVPRPTARWSGSHVKCGGGRATLPASFPQLTPSEPANTEEECGARAEALLMGGVYKVGPQVLDLPGLYPRAKWQEGLSAQWWELRAILKEVLSWVRLATLWQLNSLSILHRLSPTFLSVLPSILSSSTWVRSASSQTLPRCVCTCACEYTLVCTCILG